MLIYVFDGSFDGLLTAIYEAYYRRQAPDKIISARDKLNELFTDYYHVNTDQEKAEKVYHSIKNKISSSALHNAYYAYLAEDCYTYIYRYLRLGWEIGRDVDLHLAHKDVAPLLAVVQKVSREKHRMLGLLRFKKVHSDLYYAAYEPDHNITGLIAPHFASRLSDQNWIIHDVKRAVAAVYNQNSWYLTDADVDLLNIAYDSKEAAFQQLWKKYFQAISISNRTNPRLQKSFMPVRYWKHLIEK